MTTALKYNFRSMVNSKRDAFVVLSITLILNCSVAINGVTKIWATLRESKKCPYFRSSKLEDHKGKSKNGHALKPARPTAQSASG